MGTMQEGHVRALSAAFLVLQPKSSCASSLVAVRKTSELSRERNMSRYITEYMLLFRGVYTFVRIECLVKNNKMKKYTLQFDITIYIYRAQYTNMH